LLWDQSPAFFGRKHTMNQQSGVCVRHARILLQPSLAGLDLCWRCSPGTACRATFSRAWRRLPRGPLSPLAEGHPTSAAVSRCGCFRLCFEVPRPTLADFSRLKCSNGTSPTGNVEDTRCFLGPIWRSEECWTRLCPAGEAPGIVGPSTNKVRVQTRRRTEGKNPHKIRFVQGSQKEPPTLHQVSSQVLRLLATRLAAPPHNLDQ
jgi:hypothetical protein